MQEKSEHLKNRNKIKRILLILFIIIVILGVIYILYYLYDNYMAKEDNTDILNNVIIYPEHNYCLCYDNH